MCAPLSCVKYVIDWSECLKVENSRMVGLALEQLEDSLLSHISVSKHYSSDQYNAMPYSNDQSTLHAGLDKAMLAHLTPEPEEADCISV